MLGTRGAYACLLNMKRPWVRMVCTHNTRLQQRAHLMAPGRPSFRPASAHRLSFDMHHSRTGERARVPISHVHVVVQQLRRRMCNKVAQVATRNSLCNGASGGESIGADEPTKFAPCRVSHFQKSDTESVRSPAPAHVLAQQQQQQQRAREGQRRQGRREGRRGQQWQGRRRRQLKLLKFPIPISLRSLAHSLAPRSLHPYFFLSPVLRPSFARGIYSLPSRLDSVPRNRRTTTSERGYCHGLSIPPSLPLTYFEAHSPSASVRRLASLFRFGP